MINDGEKIKSTNNGFLMKLEFGLRIEEISQGKMKKNPFSPPKLKRKKCKAC
jgi:hypothetical protein